MPRISRRWWDIHRAQKGGKKAEGEFARVTVEVGHRASAWFVLWFSTEDHALTSAAYPSPTNARAAPITGGA